MTEMESWEHYVGLNWTDRFDDGLDEEEQEVVYFNLFVDGSKLSEDELTALSNEIDRLNHYEDDFSPFQQESNFIVEDVWKDDEESATSFTIDGWATEFVLDEIFDCFKSYNVNWQDL